MVDTPDNRTKAFLQEVESFRKSRVSKLRNINHWWSITLTVTGITLTAVTTVLGVIDNENYKNWIKFGIALSGSVAVLSQSANKEFRVKGKAGKYAQVEAHLLVLESKLRNIQNYEELQQLQQEFHQAILDIGDIEFQTEEDKS
ncbi:hypothetical protein NIES2109_64710 (plasmid) [Nostoc sp. HK-01]|nr:hypothetical protein NIES2109_64710 [Nostoc sp. HK-01]